MGICSDLTYVKSNAFDGTITPLRCKRWSCDHCAPINRQKVIGIARRAKPDAMLTLTLRPNENETPDEMAGRLKAALRLLRLRLKRHGRFSNFHFMAVFERHKSGFPHLHLLLKSQYIPWRWLRSTWEGITGSHEVHIRKISSQGLEAFYVAKYIGKDLAGFRGCKRWWRSYGYSTEDRDTRQPEWTFLNEQCWKLEDDTLSRLIEGAGGVLNKDGPARWQFELDPATAPPVSDLLHEASKDRHRQGGGKC